MSLTEFQDSSELGGQTCSNYEVSSSLAPIQIPPGGNLMGDETQQSTLKPKAAEFDDILLLCSL